MKGGRPFPKGKSGNPGGRPKGFGEFQRWCRANSDKAGEALIKNLKDDDGGVRNKAAEIIWAYAWGKPKQQVEVSGDEDKPLKHEVAHAPPSPDELADVLRLLVGAGALPDTGAATATDASARAEVVEVLGTPADDDSTSSTPRPE